MGYKTDFYLRVFALSNIVCLIIAHFRKRAQSWIFNDFIWFFFFHSLLYFFNDNVRRLIGSLVIESAAICYQIFPIPFHLESKQHYRWLMLSLIVITFILVLVFSGDNCIYIFTYFRFFLSSFDLQKNNSLEHKCSLER